MFIGIDNSITGVGSISPLAMAINSATFYAPLTSSLALSKGTGSATFTRATTATVTDFEGVIRTAKAGEARFEGARRVENLLTFSQDFGNAAWTKQNSTVSVNTTTAPDGTTTADSLIPAVGTANYKGTYRASGYVVGGPITAAQEYYVKAGSRSFVFLLNHSGVGGGIVWFNLAAGTVGTAQAGMTGYIFAVGNGWYRVSVVGATYDNIGVYACNADNSLSCTGDGVTAALYIWGAQLENVTGQSIQTAGEYVSTNVLTAPLYHGAGVDGVRYLETTLAGTPIPDATLKGVVVEEARTNAFLYSEDFTQASWVKTNTTVTSTNNLSPSGALNASLLTQGVSGTAQVSQTIVSGSGQTYTISSFVKYSNNQWVYLRGLNGAGTSGFAAWFNIQNGLLGGTSVLGTGTIVSSSITPSSNGYYRISVTGSIGAFTSFVALSSCSTANGAYTSANNAAAYRWGAQLELGNFASSYISTAAASVTRNASVDSYPTASNIGTTGAIALTFTPYHAPSGTVYLWGTYTDANNSTQLLHDGTSFILRKRIAGVNYDASIASAFVANTRYKIAARFGTGGQQIALNGVLGTANANVTAAVIAATMQTGSNGNGTGQPCASLRTDYAWSNSITDTQLQAITS